MIYWVCVGLLIAQRFLGFRLLLFGCPVTRVMLEVAGLLWCVCLLVWFTVCSDLLGCWFRTYLGCCWCLCGIGLVLVELLCVSLIVAIGLMCLLFWLSRFVGLLCFNVLVLTAYFVFSLFVFWLCCLLLVYTVLILYGLKYYFVVFDVVLIMLGVVWLLDWFVRCCELCYFFAYVCGVLFANLWFGRFNSVVFDVVCLLACYGGFGFGFWILGGTGLLLFLFCCLLRCCLFMVACVFRLLWYLLMC